ncbi:MAG TPA: NAD+ synthase [Bacteroidia bacterium]|nr:NAD+ synthase [Bacteroidia bacterium]HNT80009.1 NAD+ synthase [Bacteroidia bacterium]
MKIALAQLNFRIADFEGNSRKIINAIQEASQQNCQLIVFAELSVCGYPPLDFLETPDFIQKCNEAIHKIAAACKNITAILGAPSVNPVKEGKNLFNSAYVLNQGTIQEIIHKSLLPTYDVFDEYRYFEPATQNQIVQIGSKKIALTICEDLWNLEDDPLYVSSPMDKLILQQPDFMINIAASPFAFGHPKYRSEVLKKNVDQYKIPLLYVNQIGSQTELIFDGGSMVLNRKGDKVVSAKSFKEDLLMFDLNDLDAKPSTGDKNAEKYDEIYSALLLGIRDYFSKMNFKNAILGLSGGIDSALVLTLASHALGNNNVKAILMPSPYSSKGSIDDSIALCNALAVDFQIIPISDSFTQIKTTLENSFEGKKSDVAEENIQARLRGLMLMAISNKHGYILLNTSNKSELAVGYGTLYGDMCGGLSVIGDLYKTEVYELSRYINQIKMTIPEAILNKAPSAELRPDQKDSDSLPDYSLLDNILYRYIEQKKSTQTIIEEGYDEATVRKMISLVNINEYKRKQFAPILRVSRKAFGMGRRFPIVANY